MEPIGQVITQQCPPRLRRWLAVTLPVRADRGFRHLHSQLKQFPRNTRCSPQWIGSCAGSKHEGLPILGGLPGRLRDFLVSYYAKALRCQEITVAGGTMRRHGRQLGNQRDNKTHSTRSERYDRVNCCKAGVLKADGVFGGNNRLPLLARSRRRFTPGC